jgi:hypothetical protein
MSGGQTNETVVAHQVRLELEALLTLPSLAERFPLPGSTRYAKTISYLLKGFDQSLLQWNTVLGWLFVHRLGQVVSPENFTQLSRSWVDEWLLGQIMTSTSQEMGVEPASAWQVANTIRLLTVHRSWLEEMGAQPVIKIFENWLQDSEVQRFINVNRYKGVLWFNQEAFETFLWWMLFMVAIQESANPALSSSEVIERLIAGFDIVSQLLEAEQVSGFQIDKLIDVLKKGTSSV